jgi:hypothetical protein
VFPTPARVLASRKALRSSGAEQEVSILCLCVVFTDTYDNKGRKRHYCVFGEFGTNSVQLRERKNSFLVPKRRQVKHLDFLILLLESRRSSPSSYSASCWTYGIARGVNPESASHEDSTRQLE